MPLASSLSSLPVVGGYDGNCFSLGFNSTLSSKEQPLKKKKKRKDRKGANQDDSMGKKKKKKKRTRKLATSFSFIMFVSPPYMLKTYLEDSSAISTMTRLPK